VNCPICGKRKAARYCPAKGQQICAVCCGTEREVAISCPADCPYLIAAHRYEDEHKREVSADAPFIEERLPQDILHTQRQLMSALAFQIAKFASNEPTATDPDVLAAVAALAATYKTLQSGLLYEKIPEIPAQRNLYLALRAKGGGGRQFRRDQGHKRVSRGGVFLPDGNAAIEWPAAVATIC